MITIESGNDAAKKDGDAKAPDGIIDVQPADEGAACGEAAAEQAEVPAGDADVSGGEAAVDASDAPERVSGETEDAPTESFAADALFDDGAPANASADGVGTEEEADAVVAAKVAFEDAVTAAEAQDADLPGGADAPLTDPQRLLDEMAAAEAQLKAAQERYEAARAKMEASSAGVDAEEAASTDADGAANANGADAGREPVYTPFSDAGEAATGEEPASQSVSAVEGVRAGGTDAVSASDAPYAAGGASWSQPAESAAGSYFAHGQVSHYTPQGQPFGSAGAAWPAPDPASAPGGPAPAGSGGAPMAGTPAPTDGPVSAGGPAPVPPMAGSAASASAAPGNPAPTAGYVPPSYAQTPHAGPGAVPPSQPTQQPTYTYQPYQQANPYAYAQPSYQAPVTASKDHVAAGLLAIFLGCLGIHKFYLGYNTPGFIMLAVTILGSLFTFGLAGAVIWVIAIIEGVLYLTKSQTDFEQVYVFNKREWF